MIHGPGSAKPPSVTIKSFGCFPKMFGPANAPFMLALRPVQAKCTHHTIFGILRPSRPRLIARLLGACRRNSSSFGRHARTAWIITAGRGEQDKQAIVLAKRLGCEITMKNVLPAPAIKWLFPVFQKRLLDHRQKTFGAQVKPSDLPWFLYSPRNDTLAPPYPSVVLSTCAETTLAALQTKASSDGCTRAICIGMPFVGLDNYDVAVMGRWEWPTLGLSRELKGSDKVVPLEYSLTTIDDGVETIADHVPPIPKTLEGRNRIVAVLVGGGSEREFAWRSEDVTRLTKMLERIVDIHEGQILLHLSQRATDSARVLIISWHERLSPARRKRVALFDERDPDSVEPVAAILQRATHIAVTADSIPMLSDALAMRKPLYVVALAAVHSNARKQIYTKLIKENRLRKFAPSRNSVEHGTSTDVFSDIGEHPEWDLSFNDRTPDVVAQVARRLWDEGK
ncbi:hypothetical protein HDU88_003403 [Geranomyces variabilis]|nr:hypothetical protein HDU88_003403 [Geranomyces variabilis]